MRVKSVEYIKDYKLKLLFKDKKTKIVDLKSMIKGSKGIFSPLKDLDYFKKVTLDDCQLSICWPNGADICPDVLYEMGIDVEESEKKPRSERKQGPTSASEKSQTRIVAKPKN
jgi:Protein of unknown function (DUF2442)